MKSKKNRWAEVGTGSICLIDKDGQILARVTKHVIDGTFKYQDLEFIDAHGMSIVEEGLRSLSSDAAREMDGLDNGH